MDKEYKYAVNYDREFSFSKSGVGVVKFYGIM